MKDGIHVFWLREPSTTDDKGKVRCGAPVACVASQLVDGTLKFAVATHNPHDKFNRATGRNKAIGRLKAQQPTATKGSKEELHHKMLGVSADTDIRKAVLEAIATEPKFGISAVRAAMAQLSTLGQQPREESPQPEA